jgi:hypothetical protein
MDLVQYENLFQKLVIKDVFKIRNSIILLRSPLNWARLLKRLRYGFLDSKSLAFSWNHQTEFSDYFNENSYVIAEYLAFLLYKVDSIGAATFRLGLETRAIRLWREEVHALSKTFAIEEKTPRILFSQVPGQLPVPKSPDVSILSLSFNNVSFIGDTLKTLAGQTYKNFEFIVIDGDSVFNPRSQSFFKQGLGNV